MNNTRIDIKLGMTRRWAAKSVPICWSLSTSEHYGSAITLFGDVIGKIIRESYDRGNPLSYERIIQP